jgi:tRNA nucleotidyltransferase (CCA-adding enzyme)
MHEQFKKALPILKRVEEAGYEAFFVGGSIRDYLLNRPIADVDIATSATPDEIKSIFPKTIDLGIEHGTIMIQEKGETYEVTTFRSESDYQDFRHPGEVRFIRSLEEDLRRRDFTMNAIAMNRFGEIRDPFNGQADLKKKRIQTVGAADERFMEDALRMMRAVRFVSQLGFTLDPKTEGALCKNAMLLRNISIERITAEFQKLLKGIHKKQAYTLLAETGLYKELPGLKEGKEALEKCTEYQMDELSEDQLWLLLLFELNPEDPMVFLRKWKLPSKKMKYLSGLVRGLRQRMEKEWTIPALFEAKKEAAINIEVVYAVLQKKSPEEFLPVMEEVFNQMVIMDRSEISVTGNDLLNWYNKPAGPWIKKTLHEIETSILLKKVKNDKGAIKEWLQTCSQQPGSDY